MERKKNIKKNLYEKNNWISGAALVASAATPRAAPHRRRTRRSPPLAPPAPQRTARAGSAPGGRPRAPRLSWSAPGCLPLQRGRRARRRPRGRARGRGRDRPAARLGERGRCDALWSSSFPVSGIGGSMEQKEKKEGRGAMEQTRSRWREGKNVCSGKERRSAEDKAPWAPRTWMGKKIDRRRGYVTVDLKLSIADGTCASSTERNENRPPGD